MNQQLESTFLTAIGQNQQKLLRVCSVYAEDEDDKKDLFQESLIHIWQSMPSFEAKSSISTWMFRITLNVCMRLQSQIVRKRKHRYRKRNPASGRPEHSREEADKIKLTVSPSF